MQAFDLAMRKIFIIIFYDLHKADLYFSPAFPEKSILCIYACSIREKAKAQKAASSAAQRPKQKGNEHRDKGKREGNEQEIIHNPGRRKKAAGKGIQQIPAEQAEDDVRRGVQRQEKNQPAERPFHVRLAQAHVQTEQNAQKKESPPGGTAK